MGNCTSAPAGKVKNIGLFYCNGKDTGKYKIVVTYENGKKKIRELVRGRDSS